MTYRIILINTRKFFCSCRLVDCGYGIIYYYFNGRIFELVYKVQPYSFTIAIVLKGEHMISYYNISSQKGMMNGTKEQMNWLVLSKASLAEQKQVIKDYQLPKEIFSGGDEAEEISHLIKMKNKQLGLISVLSLTNLSANTQQIIEERLAPLIFIFSDDLVITYVGDNSDFIERFQEKYAPEITSAQRLCAFVILMIYTRYIKELSTLKQTIDHLDEAARKTTENEELFRLADTERTIVYLDHTLSGQKDTLNQLWQDHDFTQKLADDNLLYDIKLRQAHAEELVTIYRDLLETIGGLFSDMMDNNLNHLMKYLDSATLIISVPALIAGIWGMNTGGLPGRSMKIGFILVMVLAIVATVLMAIHLKRKDFTK